MKTNAKSIIALSTLAVIAFLTYRKFETIAKMRAIKSIVTKGKWKVNQYRDNGVDETSNYTGYELLFKSNGTLVAKKENTLLSGHWKAGLSEKRKAKLNIDFDAASDLDELSEDWQVLVKTSQSLELEETANGAIGLDYLNLQRIA